MAESDTADLPCVVDLEGVGGGGGLFEVALPTTVNATTGRSSLPTLQPGACGKRATGRMGGMGQHIE